MPLDPVEWRVSAGGQVDSDSHGAVDFGLRTGPWSAELLTDTIELRWAPSTSWGRAWVAARGEAFAAGLFITPWTDGAPDPTRALTASYGGVDLGFVRYGPEGVWGGLQETARVYVFGAREETTIDVPGPEFVSDTEVWAGLWRPELQVSGHLGARVGATLFSPIAALDATWRPAWTVRPRVELHGGVSDRPDDVTRTRVGGLNPYVIPVAGAAWAEWWVQDYAAGRVGPELHVHPGKVVVDAGLFADVAWFDGEHAEGFGGDVRLGLGRAFVEVIPGYAPWIPRQDDVSRFSVWFTLGTDWGRGSPFR